MRKRHHRSPFLLTVTLAAGALLPSARLAGSIPPRPAPPFTLKDLSGNKISLEEHKGKVVLLDFWATWCGSCVTAMPKLQKLQERLGEKGLVVIGIATDAQGAAKVAPVVARTKVKYPILLGDETVWLPYEVQFLPTLILIDRKARIVKRFESVTDFAVIEKAVEQILQEAVRGS